MRDITVEAAMRPLANARHISVLDRIEMNVIDVSSQVGFVANGVLPISTLPNSLLAPRNFT